MRINKIFQRFQLTKYNITPPRLMIINYSGGEGKIRIKVNISLIANKLKTRGGIMPECFYNEKQDS